MRRLALLIVLCGLWPASAAAQTNVGTMTPLVKNRIDDGNGNITYRDFNPTELMEFFSRASCCDNKQFGIQMQLINPPAALPAFQVEIWVGSGCAEFTTERDTRCTMVTTRDVEDFRNLVTIDIDSALLMFPKGGCGQQQGSNTVFALIDEQNDRISYEHIWMTSPITYDTLPPPAVTNTKVTGVEDAITVSWTVPTAVSDIKTYQVLCASSTTGMPLFAEPPEAEYTLPIDPTCGAMPTADAGPAPPDAGTAPLDDFEALDPRFACTGSIGGGTSSSQRIDLSGVALADDEYVFTKVIVIDNALNPTAVAVPGMARPQPVKNAWDVYEQFGGKGDGGFCFVATAVYGDYDHPFVRVLRTFRDETLEQFGLGRAFVRWYYAHSPPWADWLRAHGWARVVAQVLLAPVVALAWLWNHLGFALLLIPLGVWLVRRRRFRFRLAAALGALLVARTAAAQVVLEAGASSSDVPLSQWAVEVKLGPYHPDVDSEAGLTGRPYETTFGTGAIFLPQLELDWYPFHYWGELGLAGSIGYTQQTANAFIRNPNDPNDLSMRSEDTTGFHLIPMSLSLVYRFTELADRTYVPLVPYAKVGLSYYMWWITRGTGGLAATRTGTDAIGGTMGWQASAGISLRVDRFDPEASLNLSHDMGIEHVGLFFEITYADVAGLWQSNRLHVGDLFWSAGVNFEF